MEPVDWEVDGGERSQWFAGCGPGAVAEVAGWVVGMVAVWSSGVVGGTGWNWSLLGPRRKSPSLGECGVAVDDGTVVEVDSGGCWW